MEYTITICIVNFNSSEFVLNTLYCLDKITKNTYKVIIRDNNSKLQDFLNLKKNVEDRSNVELYRAENFNHIGSIAHGLAINDLLKKINSKYGVILDADCTFLIKNWDEILLNEINDEYPIIGTQAPSLSDKPQDFPLMFAILFDAKIMKQLNINFMPKNIEEFQDTGYELRKKYIAEGYKSKLLLDRNTRVYKLGPFKSLICVEYYFKDYKHIFASHFGRRSTLGLNKYLRTNNRKFYQIPVIGAYLLKKKGKKEKEEWISICKNIVKDQI